MKLSRPISTILHFKLVAMATSLERSEKGQILHRKKKATSLICDQLSIPYGDNDVVAKLCEQSTDDCILLITVNVQLCVQHDGRLNVTASA